MAIKTSTLRPGLLVSLKTSLTGNVEYRTRTIDAERRTADGALQARWETERTVIDPTEHEAGKKARGAARTAISRVCSTSAFGLLCPEANADALETAIAEARAIADAFNASATLTRLTVYAITGRIAADDVEAARAINSEVRELLETMRQGVADMDPEAIREAANKARGLGQMLQPEAEARLRLAIEAARGAARQITKAGDTAALVVDKLAMRKIAESRTAFLDMDEAGEVAAPVPMGRGIDFQHEPGSYEAAAPAPMGRALDLFA
jgi:hypothetical protein